MEGESCEILLTTNSEDGFALDCQKQWSMLAMTLAVSGVVRYFAIFKSRPKKFLMAIVLVIIPWTQNLKMELRVICKGYEYFRKLRNLAPIGVNRGRVQFSFDRWKCIKAIHSSWESIEKEEQIMRNKCQKVLFIAQRRWDF